VSGPVGDAARVTVLVAVEPAVAFDVFTKETDLWWRRGPRYRPSGRARGDLPGVLHLEPGVGGRLFEACGEGQDAQLLEVGRVTVWEPPARLVLEWRNTHFAPGEKTEIEVQFEATASGTRVTLEHRGWAALRADHPARHGHTGAAFSRMIGSWWGELLGALREHAAEKTSG
jgi:uncharacterized protein YndB with AHSA1/START domain